MKTSSRSGFTVIELITVIAIVSILMAILTPVVSNMMGSARRSSDASNLRQLAMATIAYINEAGATKSASFVDMNSWAMALAKSGNFNEAALFLATGDPALTGTLPTKIFTTITTTTDSTTNSTDTIDTTFAASNLGVAAAKTLNLNSSAASTPVVWTRGLQADGTWSATSPYGTKGGYVAFLDGHVTFYSKVPTDTISIPTSDNTLQRGS